MTDSEGVQSQVYEINPDSKGGYDIIRSIGYVSLCVSLFLFLTIKIMKYLLARKKFKFRVENSQNNTPNSLTPVLKRSYTP